MLSESNCKLASKIGLLTILLVGLAEANIIVVGPLGSEANYNQIQDAIDAANPGDTIRVLSGIYYENVFLYKALILQGEDDGAGMPLVDACYNECPITISADGAVVEGFEVINSGSSWMNGGILVDSDNNIITKNFVHDNNFYGIILNCTWNNEITNNQISMNTVGVGICSSGATFISMNNIKNNEEGIEVRRSDATIIDESNVICGNIYGICYDFYSKPKSDIRDPTMTNNDYDYYPTNWLVPIGFPVSLPPWKLASLSEDDVSSDEYYVYPNEDKIVIM